MGFGGGFAQAFGQGLQGISNNLNQIGHEKRQQKNALTLLAARNAAELEQKQKEAEFEDQRLGKRLNMFLGTMGDETPVSPEVQGAKALLNQTVPPEAATEQQGAQALLNPQPLDFKTYVQKNKGLLAFSKDPAADAMQYHKAYLDQFYKDLDRSQVYQATGGKSKDAYEITNKKEENDALFKANEVSQKLIDNPSYKPTTEELQYISKAKKLLPDLVSKSGNTNKLLETLPALIQSANQKPVINQIHIDQGKLNYQEDQLNGIDGLGKGKGGKGGKGPAQITGFGNAGNGKVVVKLSNGGTKLMSVSDAKLYGYQPPQKSNAKTSKESKLNPSFNINVR